MAKDKFIVITTEPNGDQSAYGPYSSFQNAEADCRIFGNAIVLPLTPYTQHPYWQEQIRLYSEKNKLHEKRR